MLPTRRRLARWLASPLLALSAVASLPETADAGRVIVVPPTGGAVVISNGRHTFLPYVAPRRYGLTPRAEALIESGADALAFGRYERAERQFGRAIAHEERHGAPCRARLHRASCR